MEKVLYRTGDFVDYKNEVHKYVICTVQQTIPTKAKEFDEYDKSMNSEIKKAQKTGKVKDRIDTTVGYYLDDYGMLYQEDSVVSTISIGLTICNPADKYNADYGKKLAYKLAKQRGSCLFATRSGLINDHLAIAMMDNEEKYLHKNPGCYIKGYNYQRKKYEEKMQKQAKASNLSEEEKQIIKYFKNEPKYSLEELEKLSNYITSDTKSYSKK